MDGLQTFDNGYALIIGVGADLPMTVVDATAIRDILVDPDRAAYKPDNVKLLTEKNATRESILNSFDELINRADDIDDTVIVYYSGHGGFDEEAGEYYLVPYNFNPDDRANTGISAREFTQKINAIRSQKLVVFLDCCHAGGMAIRKDIQDKKLLNYIKSDNFREKAPENLINQLQQGGGRFFIASSRENEYSIAAKPYSIFTECLIKALAGAGTVENPQGYAKIFDVTGYLLDSVPRRSEDFPPYTQSQNPVVKYVEDATNFALCYYSGGKTVKTPLPDAPSPVFTDSQTHNLTIYGVVYELQLNKRKPLRDVKVKIPDLMNNSTRTNIDGNFILTNVPANINAGKIEIFWNDNSYLLPISEEGQYEIEKTPEIISPPPTNWFKEIFDFIKTLFADDFWKKAIVLLVGLIAFSIVVIIVLTNPDVVSCENSFIQRFIAALIGLYSALVLFFFVPPNTSYKNSITIVTSTGFMLAVIVLFSKATCQESIKPTLKTIKGKIIQINPYDNSNSAAQGAKVTLSKSLANVSTGETGDFKFENASSEEDEIKVYINSQAKDTFRLYPDFYEYKIVNPSLDSRIINYVNWKNSLTEDKDKKNLAICEMNCKGRYSEISDNNYSYQIFSFKKNEIRHESGFSTFYFDVEIPLVDTPAKFCNSNIEGINGTVLDFIDDKTSEKYIKSNADTSDSTLNIEARLCVITTKDFPVATEVLKVTTWSQK